MAEKKVIVDIDINAADIKAATEAMDSARAETVELNRQLNELKKQQKESAALFKVGAIDAKEYAKQQTQIKEQITQANKGIREANKTMQQNKTVVEAAKGSNDQLRARLALLTKEYNALSKEQRENSKEGKQMQATIKGLSDKLKENEKAVGDNRRNVGNYESALKGVAGQINVMGVNLGNLASQLGTYRDGLKASQQMTKASIVTTGGLSGALQVLKVALISTGIGAVVVALGTMIAYLTQTKRGAELLSQGMAAVGATISVVVDRISAIGEAVTKVFTGEGSISDVIDTTKESFNGLTDEIIAETKAAAGLEKQMQALKDAERELTVDISKRKAEVAALQLLAEDETKSFAERQAAIQKANQIQEEQMEREMDLQRERVRILEEQLALGENLEEDEQKLAEERAKLGDIEAANLKKLRTLKAKENSIVRQQAAEENKRANAAKKRREDEIKAEEKRQKEITKGYQEERRMIDDLASVKVAQAMATIENEQERNDKIAYIQEQALRDKIANIDDETAAYTASADAIGAVDEERYHKQLAERAKYEAQLAEMDRAAKAEAFNREIELLNGKERIENQQAELSIDNDEKLQQAKYKIALKYAELRLQLMRESAFVDGILSEEEKVKLKEVELLIQRIKKELKSDGESAPTLADLLGVSDEDLQAIQAGLNMAMQAVQTIQNAIAQGAQNRLQEIDERTQAEIASVEASGLSEESKQERLKKIEREAAQERYRIELEQFKAAKATSIIMAIIQTAQAVMAAYTAGASLGPAGVVAGPAMAAAAGVLGAVQIGTIASQKPPAPPKFSKGGVAKGPSHEEGGIPFTVGGRGLYEMEGDEIILTKGVYKDPYLREQASILNQLGGGDPLTAAGYMAAGGVASATVATRGATRNDITGLRADVRSLGDSIAEMQPIVRVTDINRVNGQMIKVQTTSDL